MEIDQWNEEVLPFIKKHSQAKAPLLSLEKRIRAATITNPNTQVQTCISNHADYVKGSDELWVFNIKRNYFRLIAEISPDSNGIFSFTVIEVLGHVDYVRKYPGYPP